MSQKSGSKTIAAGATFSIASVPAGAAVAVAPGSGGTIKVQYRISQDGPLIDWSAGAVSAATVVGLTFPVFELVFSATTQDGLAEWRW